MGLKSSNASGQSDQVNVLSLCPSGVLACSLYNIDKVRLDTPGWAELLLPVRSLCSSLCS